MLKYENAKLKETEVYLTKKWLVTVLVDSFVLRNPPERKARKRYRKA